MRTIYSSIAGKIFLQWTRMWIGIQNLVVFFLLNLQINPDTIFVCVCIYTYKLDPLIGALYQDINDNEGKYQEIN